MAQVLHLCVYNTDPNSAELQIQLRHDFITFLKSSVVCVCAGIAQSV